MAKSNFKQSIYQGNDPVSLKQHAGVVNRNQEYDSFLLNAREMIGLKRAAASHQRYTLGDSSGIMKAMALITGALLISGCAAPNTASTYTDFTTLKYDESNCAKYQKSVDGGMSKIFDWEEACKDLGIKDVSKDNPQNLQGSEKKSTDDGALDAGKKDIGSTTTTLPEDKMPIEWDALQKHYTAAKGEIKSEYIEEAAYGSKGDSLFLGVKMNEGKANGGGATLHFRQSNGYKNYDEIMYVVVNSTSLVEIDATNKEHAAGIKYYRSNDAIVVEIPNIIPVLEKEFDTNPYVFAVDDNNAAKGEALDFVLIDKKIFEN